MPYGERVGNWADNTAQVAGGAAAFLIGEEGEQIDAERRKLRQKLVRGLECVYGYEVPSRH